MTDRPGDPADSATDAKADGAFGGVTNHRAGYGHDKLARLIDYLRRQPRATLASGEGALLLAEIDRLRDQLHLADQSARSSSAEAARLGRILAALREPSGEEFAHDAGVHRVWGVAGMADEIMRLRDENAALTAAVERVRLAHKCGCPILRALEETP